jgi:glycolate oxidase
MVVPFLEVFMIKQSLYNEFLEILGKNRVFTEVEDLITYSYDAAPLDSVTPAAVLMPGTSEELGKLIMLCHENKLPITVRGAGTNLSGGTIPLANGVVILTGLLNKILEINEADMYAVVQPGVVTAKLAAQVAAKDLFYPPDPGSQAVSTLGGNVMENAGGLLGLKYGVTKDYVMGLSFYDAMGNYIKSGSKTVKCATGYNITGLMVGSEGTLGILDEIILKLIPIPEHRKSMIAAFKSIEDASQTVARIISSKIIPATLEIMDKVTIQAVEAFSSAGLPTDAGALLLIEVDGYPAQVEDDASKVVEICKKYRSFDIKIAQTDEEREKVWSARRSALSALARMRPTLILEDATVPRSKIPDMVRGLTKIADKYQLTIGTFGHAGDGNLHPTILTDRRDKKEWHKVEKAIEDIFEHALALGGTLSGEHGTGIAKSAFLANEIGQASVDFSKRLRRAVDPNNILNPGKISGV